MVQLHLPCPWVTSVPGSLSFHRSPSVETPPLRAQTLPSLGSEMPFQWTVHVTSGLSHPLEIPLSLHRLPSVCWIWKFSLLDATVRGATLHSRNPGHLAARTVSLWWSHFRPGHGSSSQGSTFPAPSGALPRIGKSRSPCNGIRGTLPPSLKRERIFIPCWRWISLPAHPSHSSPHLPSLSVNLVIHLPPALLLCPAKFPSAGAARHVRQGGREAGRDANPSRSPSGIRVSAERALPFEGQRNISSPAISRKTDGGTKGGGLGLSGEASGGGEKPLLSTVGWEEVVLVLVVCFTCCEVGVCSIWVTFSKAIPR